MALKKPFFPQRSLEASLGASLSSSLFHFLPPCSLPPSLDLFSTSLRDLYGGKMVLKKFWEGSVSLWKWKKKGRDPGYVPPLRAKRSLKWLGIRNRALGNETTLKDHG